MGWKARFKDRLRKECLLDSMSKVQNYDVTIVYLRGKVLPAMQIIFYKDENQLINKFFTSTGFPFGFASEERVKKYLESVSVNLKHYLINTALSDSIFSI